MEALCCAAFQTERPPPWSLAPDVVRDAKSAALRCLRPLTDGEVEKSVVRAQYIRGEIDGREVPDYAREVTDYFSRRHESIHNPITTETFDLATELRGLHGTKTPDALHLAAAILGGCQEFWTNDHRLTAAARNRIELKVFS